MILNNLFGVGPGLPPGMQGPGGHSLDGSDQGTPVSTDSDCSTSEAGPSLSGVKVPNENLNPQQLRKRAEKLGLLNELNKQLFPDEGGPGGPGPGGPGGGGPGPPGGAGPAGMGPGGPPMTGGSMGPGGPGGMGPMGPGGPMGPQRMIGPGMYLLFP